MKPDALYMIDKPDFSRKLVAPLRSFRQPPRLLQTYLTDENLKDFGLDVFEINSNLKVDFKDLLNPVAEPDWPKHGGQWLMRGPANDRVGATHEQRWNAEFRRRLDDLRETAANEGLTFDEVSAKAAVIFISRLPFARRPGAFLVNGNIRLVWDRPDGQQVGLQFRGENKIQFVIFQADGNDLGSLMGVKSSDAVFGMITAPDVLPLIADA